MIKKILGKYLLQELISFIQENKKLKLFKNNSYFLKNLDLSIYDYKVYFFQKKIQKYTCFDIYDYYIEFFKNCSIDENKEKLNLLFFDCLSKNINFELNILDKNFDLIINNPYFKKNVRINMDGLSNIKDYFNNKIPKLLLIKNNKLTDKAIKVFKDIFNLFSTNGNMNKIQGARFVSSIIGIQVNKDSKYVNNLFSKYDIDNDGLLSFEDLINFYLDLIINKIDRVWEHLYLLGYNNLLEKYKEIDYNYILNFNEEFEGISSMNLMKILKEKINKLSLLMKVDKIFFYFFRNKRIFENLKIIEISNYNLNQMINLNIICPNINELNLKIIEQDLKNNNLNDINGINNIFPNMTILIIEIKIKFNLFNLLKTLQNSKIEHLKIYFVNFDNDYYKFNNKILLEKIKNLEIEINGVNINKFLFHFFNYIELPYLREYIINIDLNEISNQSLISNNNDYNIINQFIIQTVNNKDKFNLKSFFFLPNKLRLIRYLQLNFKYFFYVYKKKRGFNYLFKFNMNNINEFKQYYSNLDLSIDESEIIKYKKIDIKGISYRNERNIIEIIEKKDINLCDIYCNLNQKQYFIKSISNLRTIYSEKEIQTNMLILNKSINGNDNFNNLKYINLNIGNINDIYVINFLFKLIKKKKLKSLILRLNPNIFNQLITFLLQFIEYSKSLKIINITQNIENPKYNLNSKIILKQFPKLNERKYYFDEFIIGNQILVSKKQYSIIIYEIKKKYLGEQIKILGNENKEILQKCIIYLNNKEINSTDYIFSKEGKYKFKFIFKENIKNMSYMFYNCSSLNSLDLSNFNTNNVTKMSYMFYNCHSLTSLNLSNFNTNNVTNMSGMFSDCSSLTSLNLSNFNTNNVTNMSNFFAFCTSLTSLDLSNFNTNNVTNMSHMFYKCSFLTSLDLSNFITTNVKDMSYMFSDCSFLSILNISNFNIEKVNDMRYMFANCLSLSNLNLYNFKHNDISKLNGMFSDCHSLTSLNISNFNTNNVINMNDMFYYCSSLHSLDLSNFNTNNVTDMSNMFSYCSSLTSLNLSNFNTNNVTNMSGMFSDCSSLTSLNLSNFNTNNVTNMSGMFSDCSSLTSLNLSNFNTNNVTKLTYMFYNCSSLTFLDLSNFNTNKIKNMNWMFSDLNMNCKIITNNKKILRQLK